MTTSDLLSSMATRISIRDARMHLSRYIERVERGETFVLCKRNVPVAEIRPLERNSGTAARLEWLRSRGVLGPPGKRIGELGPVASRPGALKRFLDERD